ncbi:uncharacterized protein LOC122644941 [Telopea speciosissima]|uniref:uncharacterized protein LOC122644941 n=1 Tax=Telopea speciosissima TaxID=54955 RepID=UPI001CC7EC70|nr:uncharacterized protein LOC122644941 [Telopea speciosissima]
MPNKVAKIEMVISFSDIDLEGVNLPHEDALMVQVEIANRVMHRMLVDTGVSVDVISLEAYRQFGFSDDKLKPEATYLHGFLEASSSIRRTIELPVTFGDHPRQVTIMITFIVVREPYSDQRDELKEWRGKPVEDHIPFPLSEDEPTKIVQVRSLLDKEQKGKLGRLLKENSDVFAWSASDMPSIPWDIAEHRLHVDPTKKPIQQKQRNFALDRQAAIKEEVKKLSCSGFIRSEKFPTWLANVVMVPKPNGKW